MMLIADASITLVLSDNGGVLEPEDGVMAIGSGERRTCHRKSFHKHAPEVEAAAIAGRTMGVTAVICVFTNDSILIETIEIGTIEAPAD